MAIGCRGLIVAWVAASAMQLMGAHYFVSPSGCPSGDGSWECPWDLRIAVSEASKAAPGDTIYLRGGTYVPPDRRYFYSKIAGSPRRPVVIRPYPGERVIIDGGFDIIGGWVVFRDLEVTNSSTKRTSSQVGSAPTDVNHAYGFNLFAPGVKIVNNIIHDTGGGIGTWMRAPDVEIYGNIIYYIGWSGPDRGHGHGIYGQNSTGVVRLIDNIIFDQFGMGIHVYGSEDADLNNFYIEGNMLFNNGSLSGEYSRNFYLGSGRAAANPVVVGNYTYYPVNGSLRGGDNYIVSNGCTNLRLEDNYFASGNALTMTCPSILSFRFNTLYGFLRDFRASEFPENFYFNPSNRPSGMRVLIRRNRYEPGRSHIAVYNWDGRASVQVDTAAAGLQNGDVYQLSNAQRILEPPLEGTVTGSTITLDLRAAQPTSPQGWNAPASTLPEFGVFVLRKKPGAAEGPTQDPQSPAQRRRRAR
jgi:hypothetical protein